MKQILFAFSLLLFAGNGFAQKGFGIDGSLGIGRNGGDLVYPLLIEGRMQLNDYLSVNLGLGLWNSGFKGAWEGLEETTSTIYSISSNKTLPSMQLGTRVQVPVFMYKEKQIRLFVEPKLYFLPFSAQKVELKESHYDLKVDIITEEITYKPNGEPQYTRMKSDCHPRLYGGIQVGFIYELIENVDLAISYGYTRMDLFKDLRGVSMNDKAMNEWPLNPYLPRKDLQMINVSFHVNLDLN
ncbi:MAG: hypothetical protein PHS30_06620 [Bacteroidales bacterium]|nr:hypothetical protein [Bacteroidales bacterium]